MLLEAIKGTIEFIKKNHYESIYYIICFLIIIAYLLGTLITWIYAKRKISADIEKTKIESKMTRMNLVDKIREAQLKFVEDSKLLQDCIKDIIDALRNRDKENARKLREDAKTFYFNDYYESLKYYLSLAEIDLDDNRKGRKHFIDDVIFRHYASTNNFLQAINDENILQILNITERTIISRETLNSTVRYVQDNIYFFDYKRKKKLKQYLKKFNIN